MVRKKKRNCDTEGAYCTILDRIITGQYPPGFRMKELELAEEFDFSRTPARDLLRQLAYDGIVELKRNRGATVIGFTISDVEELYDIRACLEALAIECAIMSFDLQQLAAFRTRALQLDADSEPSGHMAYDYDFHTFIAESTRRPRLIALLCQQSRLMQGFRHMGYADSDVRGRAIQQHQAVLDALIARNAEGAKAAMRKHIEDSKITLLSHIPVL